MPANAKFRQWTSRSEIEVTDLHFICYRMPVVVLIFLGEA